MQRRGRRPRADTEQAPGRRSRASTAHADAEQRDDAPRPRSSRSTSVNPLSPVAVVAAWSSRSAEGRGTSSARGTGGAAGADRRPDRDAPRARRWPRAPRQRHRAPPLPMPRPSTTHDPVRTRTAEHDPRPSTTKYTSASVRITAATPNSAPPIAAARQAPRHRRAACDVDEPTRLAQSIAASPRVCSQNEIA